MSECHGWSCESSTGERSKESLHIGILPGRKSPCLYVCRDAVITVLAYFRSEDAAHDATDIFYRIIRSKEADHD